MVTNKPGPQKSNSQEPKANSYFVYILRCGDGSLYVGIALNYAERVKKHNQGLGAKYTRAHLPVKLVHLEEYQTHREAAQREYQLKGWSKKKKEEYIRNHAGSLKTQHI